jgi:putative transposase
MYKAYKYRIYPTDEQKQVLEQHFGNCRWYWNYSLNLCENTYRETGKGLSRNAIQKLLPQLKKEYEWLGLCYSQCLQVVALNLSTAYKNFFDKRANYPRYKSKNGRQSISYPQKVKVDGDYIKLPGKVGKVDCRFTRKIIGQIKTTTISKNPSGQYFVSILVDDGKEIPKQSIEGKAIGIDVGITDIAVTSDGEKFSNPKWMKKHEKNRVRKERKLARKKIGSNRRNKARKAVAKVHVSIANCRSDFLHKLSRSIVDENQVIVVENLNVKAMTKNRKLSQAISQIGWGMLCTMLKYKAEWAGKTYLEVDRFFPSSKTCSHCFHKIKELPLNIRSWDCPKCQTTHDRDINASINIRNEGLRILSVGGIDTAHGGRVKPVRLAEKVSPDEMRIPRIYP